MTLYRRTQRAKRIAVIEARMQRARGWWLRWLVWQWIRECGR